MDCSPARLASNRANARKSTGPKTEQGKARSRQNALKHGLTGEGVALPEEDKAEIARRFEDLQDEFHPSTRMGRILVHRVAFLSVRLERSAEQEAAHLGEVMRHAREDHDRNRGLEVASLMEELGESPALATLKLLRTPEGTQALIAAWLDLKADLLRTGPRFWTAGHCDRANSLSGRRMDDAPVSRINELSNAIWGDFGLLPPGDGEGLSEPARQAWARQRLVEFIDEEVEALRNCYDGLDHDAFEEDREDAPRRALFDTSTKATLARRYEANAERGMFGALRQFRQVEREALENPQPPRLREVEPVGSFGAAEVEIAPEDEAASEVPQARPTAPSYRRGNRPEVAKTGGRGLRESAGPGETRRTDE